MAGRYADQFASPDAEDFSLGCRQEIEAIMIAIDAPCRWSSEGRPPSQPVAPCWSRVAPAPVSRAW